MTNKLVTPGGVVVQMHRTRFETVNISIPGETASRTALPVGMVSPSLLRAATRDDAIPTTAFVIRHPEGSLGVLYACAGGGLAVLLLDLGEPQVQAWVDESASQGHMSLVLATEGEHQLVRLPAGDCLETFTSSLTSALASPLVVRDALDAILEQVGDERLAPMWLRQGKAVLEQCSITLVMPAISVDATGGTVH